MVFLRIRTLRWMLWHQRWLLELSRLLRLKSWLFLRHQVGMLLLRLLICGCSCRSFRNTLNCRALF